MSKKLEKLKLLFNTAIDLNKTQKEFKDIFCYITSTYRKEVAFEYFDDNCKYKKIKYKTFKEHVEILASQIIDKLGDINRIVILKATNSPRWCELFWAILMAGYKPLLIDAKTSKDGTDNLAKQSNALAIITDDRHEFCVKKLKIEDLSIEGNRKDKYEWENEIIFCSSGTTGDVKLMIYNGANMVSQIQASLNMPKETNDIMYPKCMGKIKNLAMIPFHHIFGFVAIFLWYTFYGKTIVFPSSIRPDEIKSLCQKEKITHIYSVPLFWDSLTLGFERTLSLADDKRKNIINKFIDFNLNKIDKKEAGKSAKNIVRKKIQKKILGKHIRFCISGGGYLSSKTLETINGIGYHLYNGYGMTEIGVTSVELSNSVNDRLLGSIGKPFYGIEYKIDNSKDGKGELLIKSNIVHIREIIGGKEQPASLTKEGYFSSGDIAEVDQNGRYYIKGRIKDIIINADGENIFPDELEIFYKKIKNINNLCILGIKKEKTNYEDIVLVVEIPNSLTEEQFEILKQEINEVGKSLPKGSKLADVYMAKNKLPLANNMKVKRFVVKKAIESDNGEYISTTKKQVDKQTRNFSKEEIENFVEPLRNIVSEILILPKLKIDNEAHWINDLGGDSMNYVEFAQKIENKFNIKIPEDQYGQLENINDFAELVIKLKKK